MVATRRYRKTNTALGASEAQVEARWEVATSFPSSWYCRLGPCNGGFGLSIREHLPTRFTHSSSNDFLLSLSGPLSYSSTVFSLTPSYNLPWPSVLHFL